MVKTFFKYFKQYKKYAISAVILMAFEITLEIIVPFLMSILLNNGLIYDTNNDTFTGYNLSIIISIGVAMIVCAMLAFVIGIFASRFLAYSCNGFAANLREEEYKKIQSLSLNNIKNISESSLIIRLTTDVESVKNCFSSCARPLTRAPLMMIFSMTFSFIMSWQLALIFCVAMPILGICLYIIMKKIKPLYLATQNLLDKLNGKIQEDIIGIRTIKSYVIEDQMYVNYFTTNKDLKDVSIKGNLLWALTMPINQIILYATVCCILYFSGVFHSMGLIEPGTITSFITYALLNLNALIMLCSVANLYAKAQASFSRIIEVFNIENPIINKETDLKITNNDIVFKDVCFKYQDQENYLFNKINLNINQNESIGIIGPTGSSKSTLINLIERLYDVNEGEILIDGNNIKDYSLEELRSKITAVPQQNMLFSGTVIDNLRWGNKDATLQECINATKIACCYDVIMNKLDNGFDSYIEQGGVNLSGGQRQRLCIARAIISNPKILLLDDVTSALDRTTERELLNNLKTNLKNTTIIFISQKISTLKKLDRIILMDKGKILDVDTHENLLKNDVLYKEIYDLQKEAGNF